MPVRLPLCVLPLSYNLEKDVRMSKAIPQDIPAGAYNSDPSLPQPAHIIKWLRNNNRTFKDLIIREVTEPHEYDDGSKLVGLTADKFFGPLKTWCRVELALVGASEIPALLVTRLPNTK